MASVITYAIVSGPEDPESIPSHDFIEENGFELRHRTEAGSEQEASLTFKVSAALEEHETLEEPCRRFSADIPEATIVCAEVEERFDSVERMKVRVFRDGRRAGSLEHGSVFNIGAD